ncbi:MAG TPA: nicotinate-nucleotide adenylyltransferase [Actinomycetota bacterium]|nr:nicotinate-nucleotide adenylyltransferase [Actinomycetota bacterium]
MSSRRRIGVMGGTFDPIHLGHLVAASEVRHRLDLEQVLFIPAGQPWQKLDRQVTEAEHRYVMTELATDRSPFTVSRMDMDRPGPTYTVDTLREVHAQYGPADVYLVTGADALAGVRTWREPEALRELAHMVGVTRPGHPLPDEPAGGEVTILEIPSLDISSTMCRQRVARGEPIDYLVPAAVAEYIRKHALYR